MKVILVMSICSVLFVLSPIFNLARGGETETDALEIIRRHRLALGIDSSSKVSCSHQVSTVKGMGMTGKAEIWTAFPDRYRNHVDMGIMQQNVWLADGKAWMQLGTNAPRESHDFEKRSALSTSFFTTYAYLFPGTLDGTYTCVGVEKDGDRELVRIDIAPSGGVTTAVYFDRNTYLIHKMVEPSLIGNMEVVFSDYRKVEGVMVPFHSVQVLVEQGIRMEMDVTCMEFPSSLDPSILAIPDRERAGGLLFPTGNEPVEMPLILDGNHIFLQIALNDSFPVFAILDTGAGNSAIDSDLATRLDLTGEGKIMAAGAGGTTEASFVRVDSLMVGSISFSELTVAALPLREMGARLMSYPINFIVGYDILHRMVVRIDYGLKKLTLFDPESFRYDGDGQALPVHLDQNIPSISASVAEGVTGTFKIDTGSGGVVTFFKDFIEKNDLDSLPERMVPGYAKGVGGEIELRKGRIPSFTLGAFRFENIPVEFAMEERGAFSAQAADGNIGGKLLSQFTLFLDFPHDRVILEKGGLFTGRIEADPLGFSLRRDGGTVLVAHVVKGSPGERCGLERNDIVLEIDGRKIESLSLTEIYHELSDRHTEGSEVKTIALKIMRDGEVADLSLTPSEYY